MTISAYINTCEIGSPGERFRAAEQLVKIGEPAVTDLVAAIKEERPVHVKETCVWALGQIGVSSPEVVEVLKSVGDSNEPSLSSKAHYALKLLTGD